MRIGTIGPWALALVCLAACQPPELILPGQRYDIRTPLEDSLPEGTQAGAATPLTPVDPVGIPVNRALPLSLPAAQSPGSWPQRGLSPTHVLPNLALRGTLAPVFAVSIGAGNDRKHRITADPVVEGGRIFTLDSRATVQGHSTGGAALWSTDLTPTSDHPGEASGGGLAISGGRLFVTSGFGTITALDPATGATIWTQKIGAVGNAAPAVAGDTVFVVGRDNSAWAVDAATGRVDWEVKGTPGTAGYVGGAGVAVDGRIAVLPFPSGELMAVLPRSGVRSWAANVAGERQGAVYATVRDFSGDPVLLGQTLYAGNSAGRLVSFDAGTGNRNWTADEGTMGAIIPAGGSLFLVSDRAEVLRLDAATGQRIWGTPLPNYVRASPKRRQAAYAHYGPLLAGGRILVASTDGLIRLFDPVSGAPAGSVALPGGAASNPIVVGGTLYVVTGRGQLMAFR